MGVSTDGILCFGWDLGEPDSYEWAHPIYRLMGDDEWEDRLYIAHSDVEVPANPWDELKGKPDEWFRGPKVPGAWKPSDSEAYTAWKAQNASAQSAYYAAKREAIAACGFKFVRHCSSEYTMWILAARESEVSASRGYPRRVDPQEMVADADGYHFACTQAAEALGIEPPEDPGYLLASMWW